MTKFLSYGELWFDVNEEGVPGTIVHPGEDLPASADQKTVEWMAANGFTFDPMPGAPAPAPQEPAPPAPPAA